MHQNDLVGASSLNSFENLLFLRNSLHQSFLPIFFTLNVFYLWSHATEMLFQVGFSNDFRWLENIQLSNERDAQAFSFIEDYGVWRDGEDPLDWPIDVRNVCHRVDNEVDREYASSTVGEGI